MCTHAHTDKSAVICFLDSHLLCLLFGYIAGVDFTITLKIIYAIHKVLQNTYKFDHVQLIHMFPLEG